MKHSINIFLLFVFFVSLFLFTSCINEVGMPKPRGFFRISLPAKEYQVFDSTFPYRFEYPVYATPGFDQYTQPEPFWMNLDFPNFKGKIHLSYKSLSKATLYSLIEDSRSMVYKHAQKATGISEKLIHIGQRKVYGSVYFIEGKDAASPCQFYVTDSTRHFLRGALYFNVTPNNDSLDPVIDFIIADIDHLIGSLSWK